MNTVRDTLTLEVRDLEVQVLTGIYSEETHLPQPLRISASVELDCPDHFAPDTHLSASKNYMDVKRAMSAALPEGVHFVLIEAVADHIAETLFVQDKRVRRVEIQDRQARHSRKRRGDRHHLRQAPEMKLALVTGGMKRVGAAISARLAEEGWTLALHCRASAEPDHDLAAILTVHQARWKSFAADLSDPAAVETLLPAVAAHFGVAPSLIVNNASLFDDDGPESVTVESLALYQAINLNAPIVLASRLASMLSADARAAVVNITDQRVRHGGAISSAIRYPNRRSRQRPKRRRAHSPRGSASTRSLRA